MISSVLLIYSIISIHSLSILSVCDLILIEQNVLGHWSEQPGLKITTIRSIIMVRIKVGATTMVRLFGSD